MQSQHTNGELFMTAPSWLSESLINCQLLDLVTGLCCGHGVKNPWDGKWLQSEAARSGKPNKFEVQYEYMIILFHLPEINMTFANANHVTPAEKNMVFRAHVNLGHPAVKEFVRLLKAAGTRNDIIEYDASRSDVNQPDCQLQKQGSTISVW